MVGIRDVVLRQIVYEVGLISGTIDKFGDKNQTAIIGQINSSIKNIASLKNTSYEDKLRTIGEADSNRIVIMTEDVLMIFRDLISENSYKNKIQLLQGFKDMIIIPFIKALRQIKDNVDVDTAKLALAQSIPS